MTRLLNAAINRRVDFLLLVLLVFLPLQIFSQTSETEDEILVYFLPDSLELPDGTAELTDINKLKIKSKDLDNTFKKIELKAIKKAFPDFNINDTLKLKDDGSRIKLPNMSRIFKLKLKNRDNVQAVIDILSKEKGVLFAEPNGITAPGVIPNDQYFSYQWSLQSGGGTGKIQAPEAWDIYTGNSSNIIGIVDGGIDGTHPDLSGKVTGDAGYGWDGHGIHVAGIASAKTNNWNGTEYVGIAGVDWNAQLHAQRVDNTDDTGTYQAVVDAVNYSTNVRVLNNSWTLINRDI
ncbi:S8 family serine peptidase [Melioribacter sp. OK-6-Me]|uniref:S8 family serine peptidase n=1 Tax=Melioribacter sp. OK-6-Me TaxID=3423433 RepID=UPI003ED975B4